MIDREKQNNAADQLEELVTITKEYIKQLRAGQGNGLAYAMLYHLRWRLGRTVATMGVGLPDSHLLKAATEMADAEIWAQSAFVEPE